MLNIFKISLLGVVAFSLSGCLGTIVGTTVDTAIEVVKVPFKVGGAVIDVATDDELTESANTSVKNAVNSESAAVTMEGSEGL